MAVLLILCLRDSLFYTYVESSNHAQSAQDKKYTTQYKEARYLFNALKQVSHQALYGIETIYVPHPFEHIRNCPTYEYSTDILFDNIIEKHPYVFNLCAITFKTKTYINTT